MMKINRFTLKIKAVFYLLFGISLSLVNAEDNTVSVFSNGTTTINQPGWLIGNDGGDNNLVTISNGAKVFTEGWMTFIGYGVSGADNNRIIVNGSGSVLANNSYGLYVGNNGNNNYLILTNGGVSSNNFTILGRGAGYSGNSLTIDGSGSYISNVNNLAIGNEGANNTVTVRNGGAVYGAGSVNLGEVASGQNNRLIVSNSGSVVSNGGNLNIGYNSPGNSASFSAGADGYFKDVVLGANTYGYNNSLTVEGSGTTLNAQTNFSVGDEQYGNLAIISNGATVTTRITKIGNQSTANDNILIVTGNGTILSNTGGGDSFQVGRNGSRNELRILDGATVTNTANLSIGYFFPAQNNKLIVANNGTLEVGGSLWVGDDGGTRNSLMVSNGGQVTAYKVELGFNSSAVSNTATLIDNSSRMNVSSQLTVGRHSSYNNFIVSNGAQYNGSGSLTLGQGEAYTGMGGGSWPNYSYYVVNRTNFANHNSLTVSGPDSVFDIGNNYVNLGNFGNGNRISISNGGSFLAGGMTIGNASASFATSVSYYYDYYYNYGYYYLSGYQQYNAPVSNNMFLVEGPDSQASLSGSIAVGVTGDRNGVVVSNGGNLNVGGSIYIGDYYNGSGSSNFVVLSGHDSQMNIAGSLSVYKGQFYHTNGTLSVGNLNFSSLDGSYHFVSGKIVAGGASINDGHNFEIDGTASDAAHYVATGGQHYINSNLRVGSDHAGNSLSVSNSGKVFASNMIVGVEASSTNNLVTISGASSQLVVTNSVGTGTYDIRRGTNIQNGGTVRVDNLLVTNSVVGGTGGVYQLNGGTSYVGRATISNGSAFQIGNGTDTAYFRQTQAGVTNTFANGIQINTGGTFSFAGTITNVVTFNGGTLKGSGTLTTDLTIGAGAVIAPGNSPGTLGGTTETWASGGTYEWEINDFAGTAGTDPGWDLLSLSGALNITASAGNEFTIDLISLDTFNNAGNAANFDYTQDYSLIIASAAGGITGFSANAFILNTAGFSNPTSGGSWSIAQSGNNLLLNYTAPIPEPSTWAMIIGGLLFLVLSIHRRRLSEWMPLARSFPINHPTKMEIPMKLSSPHKAVLLLGAILCIGLGSLTQAQTVINGTTTTTNAVYTVGESSSGNTLLITNGGKLFVTNDIWYSSIIGSNSTATLNSVVVNGAGSLWTNQGHLYVGYYGSSNTLTISNGANVFNSNGYIGDSGSSSNNVVNVVGAGSVWSNHQFLIVGAQGAANTLTISNGANVFNYDGYIGSFDSSSNNVVNVVGAGSVWSNQYDLYVGASGAANTLTISNGANMFDYHGYIGYYHTSSNNVLNVVGVGSVWSNHQFLIVGNYGSANTLTISNGANVFDYNGYIGSFDSSSNNVVNVVGAGSVWSNQSDLYVGYYGSSNTLTISNGGSVYATNMTVGVVAPSTNNLVTLSGNNSQLVVTNTGGTATYDIRRGTNIQNGGTVRVDNLLVTNAQGAYQLNGGTSYVGRATISNGSAFQIGNGSDTAYFRQTQAGVTNTFANGIQINAGGTLSFAGTITNMVTFNGGTLKGSGTLTTDLTVGAGAVIAPGNSPGTLGGTTETWASGGTYEWEINDFAGTAGTDPGWDLINLSGALNITASAGNEFTIDLISLDTFNAAGNAANFDYTQDYSLIIASAIGGITGFDASDFILNTAGFSNPTSGGLWSIAQSGNNLLLNYTAPSPVPEPSTWVMILCGAICGAVILRKRGQRLSTDRS